MSLALQIPNPRTEQVIMNRLKDNEQLEITELEVWVWNGTAYIKGTVPSMSQKRLAGEVASQVTGVREVANMLRVAASPVTGDAELKRHIRQALGRDPRIYQFKIYLRVANGVVYLHGLVNNANEKHLIEHEIWAVPGVRGIVNGIKVLSAVPKSEEQIAAEIRDDLSSYLGLDSSRIAIDVKEGTVYLSGLVPTDYLKEAAEELVRWTPSVSRVVNDVVSESSASKRYLLPE